MFQFVIVWDTELGMVPSGTSCTTSTEEDELEPEDIEGSHGSMPSLVPITDNEGDDSEVEGPPVQQHEGESS